MISTVLGSCIAGIPFDQCSDTTAFGLDPIVLIGAVLLLLVVIAAIVVVLRR